MCSLFLRACFSGSLDSVRLPNTYSSSDSEARRSVPCQLRNKLSGGAKILIHSRCRSCDFRLLTRRMTVASSCTRRSKAHAATSGSQVIFVEGESLGKPPKLSSPAHALISLSHSQPSLSAHALVCLSCSASHSSASHSSTTHSPASHLTASYPGSNREAEL
jgi:hypothetical protein